MKKLDYIQLYMKGKHTKESIEIPDNSLVFKITNNITEHYYREKNSWSYNIIILSKEEIEDVDDSICLGNWYLSIIYLVYSEYKFNDISEFPIIEFYIIDYNLNKVDLNLPTEEIEKEGIYKIYKFKGIDSDYVYLSYAAIKNSITMENDWMMRYDTCDIDVLFNQKSSKVVYSDKYKEIYKEFCNRVIEKVL